MAEILSLFKHVCITILKKRKVMINNELIPDHPFSILITNSVNTNAVAFTAQAIEYIKNNTLTNTIARDILFEISFKFFTVISDEQFEKLVQNICNGISLGDDETYSLLNDSLKKETLYGFNVTEDRDRKNVSLNTLLKNNKYIVLYYLLSLVF